MLADAFARIVSLFESFLAGWKTFYFPAEPFVFVFDLTLGASAVVNNQALDLRLPYDLYVYGIGRSGTGVFSFLLKGSGGGVFFGNANVRSDSLWSANEPVLWLRRPFKIEKNASLSIDLTNLTALSNTVQVVLVGWKSASQFSSGR